jgi:hypothetical protein
MCECAKSDFDSASPDGASGTMIRDGLRARTKHRYSQRRNCISRRSSFISAVLCLRRSIASIDHRPCRHMPRLSPRGAPVDRPPSRRHRPFAIANGRQGSPARFRAPQRGRVAGSRAKSPRGSWG